MSSAQWFDGNQRQVLDGTLVTNAGSQPDASALLQGCKAQAYDPNILAALASDQTLVSQRPSVIKIPIWGAVSVSNVVVDMTDHIGVTPTLCKFGVYDSTGAKIADTGDIADSEWAALGGKSEPLVGGPFSLVTPCVYVLLLVVNAASPAGPGLTGTQGIATAAGANYANLGNDVTGAPVRFALWDGADLLSDLPASFDPSTLIDAQGETMPWVGLS